MKKHLKVLVIFDYPKRPAADEDYAANLSPEDWRCENNVIAALKELGHEVKLLGIHDRVRPLLFEIRRRPPDIVFNLAEAFSNDRANEANLAGFLELLQIPYTGCRAQTLSLCRHKAFTNSLLSSHRIKVPKSVLVPRRSRKKTLGRLRFPVIVKPLGLEGSDGIHRNSRAENEKACWERVKALHAELDTDALVEEFIEGREIYSAVLGNHRLEILPLREMLFENFPEERQKFATYKAKWDEKYRKTWGIKNTFAKDLPPGVEKKIRHISKTAYRVLQLNGYGRLDMRLGPDGEVYVLEVNPNPGLADDDEVALAAQKAGIKYPQLIQRVLAYGMALPPFRDGGRVAL